MAGGGRRGGGVVSRRPSRGGEISDLTWPTVVTSGCESRAFQSSNDVIIEESVRQPCLMR